MKNTMKNSLEVLMLSQEMTSSHVFTTMKMKSIMILLIYLYVTSKEYINCLILLTSHSSMIHYPEWRWQHLLMMKRYWCKSIIDTYFMTPMLHSLIKLNFMIFSTNQIRGQQISHHSNPLMEINDKGIYWSIIGWYFTRYLLIINTFCSKMLWKRSLECISYKLKRLVMESNICKIWLTKNKLTTPIICSCVITQFICYSPKCLTSRLWALKIIIVK